MVDPAPDGTIQEAAARPPAAKLDELMLAMDVVDTLRHQEGLIEKELNRDDRDAALKARLRELYQGQGLEVSDATLDEGIKALRESRFVYTPTPPSVARSLALLWIRRRVVGRLAALAVLLIALIVGWQVWSAHSARQAAEEARIALTVTLPQQLAAAVEAARGEAKVEAARDEIDRLAADGQAALAVGDIDGAKAALADLADLRDRLVRTYVLRIVSRAGEDTGVYRIPDANEASRNYYLIVEALTPDGKLLSLPVLNEETGKTEVVSKWGVRVPESTYDAVRRDKTDDGIVQNNRLGEKKRGALDPDYLLPVLNGAITEW